MKCIVCGKKFKLLANNKYLAKREPAGLSFDNPIIYEAFDCPACGCQNIVNVRENIKIESEVLND